jgi:hypothetical protein
MGAFWKDTFLLVELLLSLRLAPFLRARLMESSDFYEDDDHSGAAFPRLGDLGNDSLVLTIDLW